MQHIESGWCTLQSIVEHDAPEVWIFNVPCYQRLYTWGDEQISILLNDIVNAWERQDTRFFLGGILVVETTTGQERESGQRSFDLIDGQQRFTTLFLLSQSPGWRAELAAFGRIESNGTYYPRLNFSARPDVSLYFEAMVRGEEAPAALLLNADSVSVMENARNLMASFCQNNALAQGKLENIARYIYEKVQFVRTELPSGMDLNKLFEVINARGVQLQHHEILKARLLHSMPVEERPHYAAMWDACADMKGFVDQNLRHGCDELTAASLAELYSNKKLALVSAIYALLAQIEISRNLNEVSTGYQTLTEISEANYEKRVVQEVFDNDDRWVGSIIGFPIFLLHVLRIWLCKNKLEDLDRILDRDLTKIFDKAFFENRTSHQKDQDAREFIGLVWEIRVLWDASVIKWAEAESSGDNRPDRFHMLCETSVLKEKSRASLSRSWRQQGNPDLALLQSMLYHTQESTTHYWLTPYLYYLHENPSLTSDQHLSFLRHLDNQLLAEDTQDSLVKRSRLFMEQPWRKGKIVDFASYLKEEKGVGFRHYWFYKLDFVLWYEARLAGAHDDWRLFRFTAKNSIEHISPQQPQSTDYDLVEGSKKDAFGNLVLVSRGINSEYGNLPFNIKKQKFANSKKLGRIESLKMDIIYQNSQWNDDIMRQHQEHMIECLKAYYREDIASAG